jgi:predicted XRE-type DNA-binding protein
MARKRSKRTIGIEAGSGNVYRDLGFKNAEAMLAKGRIVAEIARIIRARRLTQTSAASVLGLSQPKVSALRRRLRGLLAERLFWLLNRLDATCVSWSARRRATASAASRSRL